MKKFFTFILLSCVMAIAMADVVENPKGGSLSSVLDENATEAIISGPLNGTDILYLRKMLLEGKLTSIDMSEARIVAGGKAYEGSNTTTNNVLGENMFLNCGNLEKIVLPKNLRRIDKCALSKCTKLKEVVVPDTVSSLGMDCFAYNNELRTVTVGRGVASFGQGVCWSSGKVADVYMYPEIAPTFGPYTFGSKPKVHIHPDSEASYRNAWAQLDVTFVTDLVDSLRVNVKEVNDAYSAFFTDNIFSELKEEYLSLSDDELRSAMEAKEIPADLQEIAVKLKNQDWGTYERQFRIQSYKPFSDANAWRDKIMASGLSFMGSPTGIWAKQGDKLYVFVSDDVAAGATLYIAGCTENNLVNNAKMGVELHKGLNIVKVNAEIAQYWLLYTVKTDDLKKKIADWPNIDIHIEGGVCDGFYDITHASDEEYKYLRDHATYPLFTIKGQHMIWNFETPTFAKVWPKTIDHSITWGDNEHMWQFQLMGLCDDVAAGELDYPPYNVRGGEALYPSYCNNVTFAIQGDPEDAGWANSTTYRTSYNGIDCVRASLDLENPDFDPWCVAHECGHNNQGSINLETCIEASNNLFSNLAVYLTGYLTSKGDGIDVQIDDFNSVTPWVGRNIWSKMRMYYQLYLYYHTARHNTSFYPELIKELRKDPLKLWKNNDQSLLKFAEKASMVANEDLTDFFEAWGFFVPCSHMEVDDYGTHYFTLTQRDIDDTKKKLSAYPRKNHEILFIEDRIKPTYRWDIWAKGTDQVRSGYVAGEFGEYGHYTDYMVDAAEASKPLHYASAVIGDTVLVAGEGGVGFAAYAADGTLKGFSNVSKLCVPCAFTDTTWTAYAVTADGTLCPLEPLSEEHSSEQKEKIMDGVIKQAQSILSIVDSEHEIVGYYHYADLLNLQSLTAEAIDHYKSHDINSYIGYVKGISDEINRLNTLERVPFETDKDYVIKMPGKRIFFTYNQNRRQLSSSRSTNIREKAKHFYFTVANAKKGTYYMCARQKDYFVTSVPKGAAPTITAEAKDAVPFTITEHKPGYFSFCTALSSDNYYISLNSSDVIEGGDFNIKKAIWNIICVDATDTAVLPIEEDAAVEAPEAIYDLSGRRHEANESLNPGLYIVNGKKVMVK